MAESTINIVQRLGGSIGTKKQDESLETEVSPNLSEPQQEKQPRPENNPSPELLQQLLAGNDDELTPKD